MRARVLVRAAAAVLVALAIGGPSPGHLGTCGGSPGAAPADPYEFCVRKNTSTCLRQCRIGGEWDATMCASTCGSDPPSTAEGIARSTCLGYGFPPGCGITQAQANDCVSALQDPARFATPLLALPECDISGVCARAGALTSSEPEGI